MARTRSTTRPSLVEVERIIVPQAEINRILVREALKGLRVARLKGGDGFVFGRAAEEIAAVRAAGLEVEIIPGITSAHACAASIALPLTLRETVRQFSIVAGATSAGVPDLDWAHLAKPGQAFAIYMGVRSAAAIRQKLLDAGADPTTAIVIVENGTLPSQRAIETTLCELHLALDALAVRGPSIIFVGLSWAAARLTRPASVELFVADAAERHRRRQHLLLDAERQTVTEVTR